MNNSDSPASPVMEVNDSEVIDHLGLTKREAFAMAAMQGYISGVMAYSGEGSENITLSNLEAAQEAVSYADALLKELEK